LVIIFQTSFVLEIITNFRITSGINKNKLQDSKIHSILLLYVKKCTSGLALEIYNDLTNNFHLFFKDK